MQQQNDRDDHSGDSDRDQQEFSVASGVSLAFIVFLLFGGLIFLTVHDYIPDNAKRAEVLLASMFSLAIVIVVVIQAGIYFRQARALDAQLEETRKATLYSQSAYITVKAIDITKFEIGQPIQVTVVFTNSGTTPAYNINTYSRAGPRSEPFTFSAQDIVNDDFQHGVFSQGILGPHGDSSKQVFASRFPLDGQGLELLRARPYCNPPQFRTSHK